MRKGTITKEELTEADEFFSNSSKVEEWLTFIEKTEPEFYKWCLGACSNFVTNLNKMTKVNINDAQFLSQTLMSSFSFGYFLKYQQGNKEVSNLFVNKTEEQKFNDWLEGKLSEKYYTYSLKGINKDSSVHKAKMAFLKRKEEQVKNSDIKDSHALFSKIESNIATADEIIEEDDIDNIGS